MATHRDHSQLMDRIYRTQRHIYDATRRLFLPGRDRLLGRLPIRAGARVLEVGCGTARNLRLLARRHPDVQFYGLDISSQMLLTARGKLRRAGLDNIHLIQSSAEGFDYRTDFHLDRPFDVIFFSYSLSMIPDGRKALATTIANLRPDGSILIVDFGDQAGWPRGPAWLLRRWLAMFHVHYRPETIDYLRTLAADGPWTLSIESVAVGYAFLAHLQGSKK